MAVILCMITLAGCQGGASDVPQVTKEVAEAMQKDQAEAEEDVEPLQEENQIPEDGIISKAQLGTIAGKEGEYRFLGETGDGVAYQWTYDGEKIKNPVEQKLKVECSSEGLEKIQKAAGNAPYGLGVTLQDMEMAAPVTLTLTLDQSWDADRVLLCSYEDGKVYQLDQGDIQQVKKGKKEISQVSFQITRAGETFYVLGGSSKGSKGDKASGDDLDAAGTGKSKTQAAAQGGEEHVQHLQGQDAGSPDAAADPDGSGQSDEDPGADGQEQGEGGQSQDLEQSQGQAADPGGDTQGEGTGDPGVTGDVHTCTLSIECSTLLENWDKVKEAKKEFVPADGWILQPVEIAFTPGETVFDVLKRAVQERDIQMESSYTPMYGSYYIEGINQLYEFDGGAQSGWMFCVNGWYPNYGCSSYTVEDGDVIEWRYTCDLGSDVGNRYMGD